MFPRLRHPNCVFVRAILLALTFVCAMPAYSVLTHQAIIDSAWEEGIKPILTKRYPGLTPEQLREAHAHAYGGAILQDMGYYPLSSHFFSDRAFIVLFVFKTQTKRLEA